MLTVYNAGVNGSLDSLSLRKPAMLDSKVSSPASETTIDTSADRVTQPWDSGIQRSLRDAEMLLEGFAMDRESRKAKMALLILSKDPSSALLLPQNLY